MKQNNGMVLPEDFVDMNDVETGYVGGDRIMSYKELMNKIDSMKGAGSSLESRLETSRSFNYNGFFTEGVVTERTYTVSLDGNTETLKCQDWDTSLNTRGTVAVVATTIVATAGITCAILGACGVFDKD